MKKKVLISIALFVTAFTLYSCSVNKIWTEQDLKTTIIQDEIEGCNILENAMFRMNYPKDWRFLGERHEESLSELTLRGEGISVEIGISTNSPTSDEKIESYLADIASNGATADKKQVRIDGKKGTVYEIGKANEGQGFIYLFENGNKIVGIFIFMDNDCKIDYALEDCLKWKS